MLALYVHEVQEGENPMTNPTHPNPNCEVESRLQRTLIDHVPQLEEEIEEMFAAHEREVADEKKYFVAKLDEVRQTVIQLLRINNPDESIVGACNNRMQEVITLRGNAEDDENQIAKLQSELEEARAEASRGWGRVNGLESTNAMMSGSIQQLQSELAALKGENERLKALNERWEK